MFRQANYIPAKKARMASAVQAALPWAKPFRPPPRPESDWFMALTSGETSSVLMRA